jgi:hypothetical protein
MTTSGGTLERATAAGCQDPKDRTKGYLPHVRHPNCCSASRLGVLAPAVRFFTVLPHRVALRSTIAATAAELKLKHQVAASAASATALSVLSNVVLL